MTIEDGDINELNKGLELDTNIGQEKIIESFESEKKIDIEKFNNEIENHFWLKDYFNIDVKRAKDKYVDKFDLPHDVTGEKIMESYDNYYLNCIKNNSETILGSGIVEDYKNSSEENPLNYEKKQEFVNVLLNPTNKLYKNEAGESVSMGEYFNDYYKELGINVNIEFSTINDNQKKDLMGKMIQYDKNLKEENLEYIKKDEKPIPFLKIFKDGKEIKIPMLAGDIDMHMPLRSVIYNEKGEEINEKTGTFMGFKITHEAQFGSTIQYNIGQIVHEADHAIRKVLDNQDVFKEEDRIISEGTAELARDRFGKIQNKYDSKNGFDYQNLANFAIAAESEGEKVLEVSGDLKHTYASGYILADQMEKVFGRKISMSTVYNSESAISTEEISNLRKKITDGIKDQKDKKIFKNFLLQ